MIDHLYPEEEDMVPEEVPSIQDMFAVLIVSFVKVYLSVHKNVKDVINNIAIYVHMN